MKKQWLEPEIEITVMSEEEVLTNSYSGHDPVGSDRENWDSLGV